MSIRREQNLIDNTQTLNRDATSPAGAKAVGANPDQAKMMSTPAQKDNALQQKIDPAKSQQKVERQAQAPMSPSAPTQEQIDKTSYGKRLERVSGLNERVDNLVQQKLTGATQSQSQLSLAEPMAEVMSEDSKAAVEAYYAAVSDPNADTSTAYEVMANALFADQAQGAPFDPNQFLQSIEQTVSSTFSEGANLQQTYTLGELAQGGDIGQSLGYEGDLALDLGIDPNELANLSIEDVQQKIQDIQEQEMSTIDGLKAELINASPDRATEIQNELRNLGAAGITGVEASAEDLQKQIDSAQSITFAGRDMTIGDMLESDEVSTTIEQALRDEDYKEELRNTEPQLVEWIEANAAQLENLRADIDVNSEEFQELQTTYREAVEGVDESVVQSIFGKSAEDMKFVSQSEYDTLAADIGNSGLFQAAKNNLELSTKLTSAMESSPEDFETLKTMDQASVEDAFNNAIKLNEPGVLQDIVGKPEGDFLLDDDMKANLVEAEGIVNTLSDLTMVTESPDFIEMVKDGTINQAEADWIAQEGQEEFDELVTWKSDKENFEAAETVDDFIQMMFGEQASTDTINQQMADLRELSSWGDQDAGNQLALIAEYFGSNGPDDKDFDGLRDKLSSLILPDSNPLEYIKDNLNKGISESRESATKSQEPMQMSVGAKLLKDYFSKAMAGYNPKPAVRKILKDGKVDYAEGLELPDSLLTELRSAGLVDGAGYAKIVKRKGEIKVAEEEAAAQAATDKYNKEYDDSLEKINRREYLDQSGLPEGDIRAMLQADGISDEVIEDIIKNHRYQKADLSTGQVGQVSIEGETGNSRNEKDKEIAANKEQDDVNTLLESLGMN